MWRLIVPLKYLRISHPEKHKFDLVFPFIFACLFFLPALSPEFRTAAMSGEGLLSRSSDLLSVLTGFFIAALAAVATFGGDEMNEIMPGDTPMTLKHSNRNEEQLTRRRFLCFLFGYLALTSLLAYLSGFAFYAFQTYVVAKFWPEQQTLAFVIFWIPYGFVLGNLLSNTLLGLFYLTDRIHRPNRVVKFNSSPKGQPDKKSTKVA